MTDFSFEGLKPSIDLENSAQVLNDYNLLSTTSGVESVFVIGCPRSGTTLLGNVIGANNECAVGDETLFLLNKWNMFNSLVLANNKRKAPFIASFTTPQKVLDYDSAYVNSIYQDLIATKPASRIAVDHTPVYAHVGEYIDLIMPSPTFVHIIRDEAAVVKSLRRVREMGGIWGQANDEARSEFRRHWINRGRELGAKAVGRYFEVSYEEFVDDPEGVIKPVLDQIGITWSEDMESATKIQYAQEYDKR